MIALRSAVAAALLLATATVAWAAQAPAAAAVATQGPFEARAARLLGELRARAGKAEAAGPLAALVRLEEQLPAGTLAPVLRELAEGRGTHPLVAALASYHLSIEEERAGEAAAAEERRRRLGFVTGPAWVLGPFDAQGRSGLGRPYPPEEGTGNAAAAAADPRRAGSFAGKEREVSWRRVPPEAYRRGALLLDALLRPESDAVAYTVSVVSSDRARAAVLRTGTPGPLKVWLNGALITERNVVRVAAADQDASRVRLRKGENWLVVKTVVASGAWRLYTRFTDEQGRPLRLAAVEAPRGAPPALARPRALPATRAEAPLDLGGLLARRAQSAGAAEALDHARYLALVRPDDAEAQLVESVLRRAVGEEAAAPADGAGASEASEPARSGPVRPLSLVAGEALVLLAELAREEDDRRAALELVAARASTAAERALAFTALGELARGRRRDAAAQAHFRRALELDPACWPAVLAMAAEEQSAGLTAAALRRLEALPPAVAGLPRVARARIRALEALGRRRDWEAALAALRAVRRTDIDATQELATAARHRGDLTTAAALLREVATARPDLLFMAVETARMLEGLGQRDQARALLEEAARRLPDEPRAHEELGRLLMRSPAAAAAAEALPHLRRALALRPQNPTLRRYVERLAAEGDAAADRSGAAEELVRAHAEDAETLARAAFAAEKTPPPTAAPAKGAAAAVEDDGEASAVLLDRRVVRVHANGLSETFAQRVVHVRSERAARENQEFYVRYTPGSQEVEIHRARVLRRAPPAPGTPPGEVEVSEATGRDDRDLSEPWYGIYYDLRAEVVSWEDLRAGDVIEVQYTVADVALRNELADYFGDFQFIGDTVTKRRWDYTLIGPAGRTFYFNAPRVPGLAHTTEKRGGEVIHRFSARDVRRVVPEPAMPGFAEAAPYLHVSTYKTWQDVARWYWHLVEDQLTADEAVRRAAAAATKGLTTDEEKVRALHRFVLDSTRYVALEFGIHGFKPYKVSQVLSRRFGDCKDKASLLLVLLREVGIPSELVLLRTRRGGRIDSEPASLAVFDHAIVYVPRLSLYLDGTAEFSGMSELPSQDQGVTVLRVGPATSLLTETPVFASAANRAARTWTVEVDGDGAGGGRIDEVLTISGQAAPEWRVHYQTPGERQERYAKVWNGRFPGARLDVLDFESVEDRNRPVVVRSRVSVPQLGEVREGRQIHLPVTSRDADYVRGYARLSRRRHDVQVAYPWQHAEEIVFKVPEGWRVLRRPAGKSERTAFGRFDLEVAPAADGRTVRVRSLVDVERHRIPAAEYGAFRKFLGTIDAALSERLVLAKDEG